MDKTTTPLEILQNHQASIQPYATALWSLLNAVNAAWMILATGFSRSQLLEQLDKVEDKSKALRAMLLHEGPSS